MQKIVFFFPWKIVSGGPFYLCNLADKLAETGKYEVYYTDFYNSLSDDYLRSYRVRKIPYFKNARSMNIFLDEPVILVTPVYWCFVVPHLHPDSKIVFINWHNESIPDLKKKWPTTPDVIEEFLRLIEKTDCVSFCDATHWMAQNALEVYCKEQYVPIVIEPTSVRAPTEIIDPDEYNIGVIGRFSADKAFADMELLENLAELHSDKPINIHLIGDGQYRKMVTNHYYGENIHIIEYGTLTIPQIQRVLSENVDVVFGMATSALEAARIGLPTVIIPNEIHAFQCNKYVFLSQCTGYMLGWGVDQLEELDIEKLSIEEVLARVYSTGGKGKYGLECLDYCLKNHSDNLKQFEDICENTKLTYAMLEPLLEAKTSQAPAQDKKQLSRTVARIKKALGKRKVSYCFLGIPIVTVNEVDSFHNNIFFLFLPLLRATRKNNHFGIHFLPLVWLWKIFSKLFMCFKKERSEKQEEVILPPQSEEEKVTREEALRRRIEDKLSRNEKIRILLLEPRIACWQFERLYHLLEDSGVFEPIVIVTPFIGQGKVKMFQYMNETYEALAAKGLRVYRGFDRDTDTFLDVKQELDPDAVFYSMFWKPHFQENFYITKFEDVYSFLYPYGLDIVSHPWRESMNFELQNKVTRFYQATIIHKAIAEDNMDNHGENVFVTGSPKLDDFFDSGYIPIDVWKKCGTKKRIIWAPHHMILNNPKDVYQLNAFLDLAEPMQELAEQYSDVLQIAFKPHPMLMEKLHTLWGIEKTEEYYKWWEEQENTQLETGAFIDLFLTSDAMILDSVSFIGEYACTGKPSFFTYGMKTQFKANIFGRALMKHIYHNEDPNTLVDEVVGFIENVVIAGNDEKKEGRKQFIDTYLRPQDGKTAAEHIYDDLYRVIIDNKRLEYKVDWTTEEVSLE